MAMKVTSEIPPAWDYNPSRWSHRLPLIAIALAGFCVAAYLSLYQLKMIKTVWDPFFYDQTVKVLTSPLSRHYPYQMRY